MAAEFLSGVVPARACHGDALASRDETGCGLVLFISKVVTLPLF